MRHNQLVPIRVLGVLGGQDVSDDLLRAWASTAHVIYGADSGADRLIAAGFEPIIVGDFDSFTMKDQATSLRLVQDTDENRTDCDKLLSLVAADAHQELTLTCVEGDLPDHVISTISSIVASHLRLRIAFRRGIGYVVRSEHNCSVQTKPGQRVSLVPLTPCVGVSLTGTQWQLTDDSIKIGGRLSVSNEATGDRVSASVSSGCALLFCETHDVSW